MSFKRDHSYQYEDKSNPFYNGDVVSIREAFKQNLGQPYSNLNKSVQKYQNQGLSLDDLINENAQLQTRIKSQEKEIQKLTSEKEMLLKSALSANQKLKGLKNKSSDQQEELNNSKQVRELEQQLEEMQLKESKLILQISQISTQLQNQSSVKMKQRTSREELEVEELISKIKKKDHAIECLLSIMRENCKEVYNNTLHKEYMSMLDRDLYSESKEVLVNGSLQMKPVEEKFINIYRNGNEILGFRMVVSQRLSGLIRDISFRHLDLKCIQLCLKLDQDGTKSEMVFPNQVQGGQEVKLANASDQIDGSESRRLNEVWFYEMQSKGGKLLGAEVKQTVSHIVNAGRQQGVPKQLSVADRKEELNLEKFKLHDVIIYTDQKLIYGVRAVYLDGNKQFHEGVLMQRPQSGTEEKNESNVIAFNKQKQYQMQRQLQYVEIDIHEETATVERMVLCYKTENSHNSRVTNLQLEIGKQQEGKDYLNKRVEVEPNRCLQCKFLNEDYVLSDMGLI